MKLINSLKSWINQKQMSALLLVIKISQSAHKNHSVVVKGHFVEKISTLYRSQEKRKKIPQPQFPLLSLTNNF